MLGTLLAVALHAAPVPQTDLDRLDHSQLLQLHEQIDESLPARWPQVLFLSGGGGGLLVSGFCALMGGVVLAIDSEPGPAHDLGSGLLGIGVVGSLLSAGALALGIVFYKTNSAKRAEYESTLTAIDERLDAYDRGELHPTRPTVPPPPELPALQPTSGALRVSAVDALTQVPLAVASLKVDGVARAGLEVDTLEPGPHELTLSCDGYREAKAWARVIAGRRVDVTVKLIPEGREVPTRLSGLARSAVDGKPLAATLEVDGKTVATADARGIFSVDVEPGRHSLRMWAPGFISQFRELDLKEGARVIFNVDLHREAP